MTAPKEAKPRRPREEVIYLHVAVWNRETTRLSGEEAGAVFRLVIAEVSGEWPENEAATARYLRVSPHQWRAMRGAVLATIDRLREIGAWRYKIRFGRPALSSATRAAIYDRDGEVCAYCASTEGPFHIDHRHPVSKGGTNDPDNLCVACKDCNLSKGAKSVSEWRAEA